jgi:hypothetical protein
VGMIAATDAQTKKQYVAITRHLHQQSASGLDPAVRQGDGCIFKKNVIPDAAR